MIKEVIMSNEIVPIELIENKIFVIRGHKVMIDYDLAYLYDVPTKRLNEQVKRNTERFPEDFMFLLSNQEKDELVANCDHLKDLKFSYNNPYAFTEQGVAMLSSVLNSPRAVQVNIQIMRTFTKLRRIFFGYKELKERLDQIESKYDSRFKAVFDAINEMIAEPPTKVKGIGFRGKG
jgi:hypothetical protein